MKIGLISDTHSFLDPKVFDYFQHCDEIWHAGDIGESEVINQLENFKPVRAVYGNIDAPEIRQKYPENQRFVCENSDIWITHIGGYPPRYNPKVLKLLKDNPPNIFICGHSHILRVMPDQQFGNFIYMNPGAAGQEGFHSIRTILRFDLENKKISNLEAIELGKRGR
ncbi:metallophosphoesterase family protein [Cytophagaceae bacterium DM2B3-1]|uniref:Phosphoesterase n=1 Tax=Xanthocytophaga flava TaxID=3048013 RepID=A0ABT7CUG0_9BACT|nr:metallophosphoesterase family protein [Xanthocytophaga flavus]MDJ1497400.1 metallophosphoesterase family protein [Xanthocytophaga flavus]